ncbi:hypothetical protein HZA57_00380 [Candidatus Poribacteria bacterium]|nr:hypothetical protein [Candidatus Poribacteria bacterium]
MRRWAERLGLMRGGVLVFENPTEGAVLADAVIHGHRRGGKKVLIHEMRGQLKPGPGSLAADILEGLDNARYHLAAADRAIPGAGVIFRDLIEDREFFLFDIHMSKDGSALRELVLCGWMWQCQGLTMATGASLPTSAAIVSGITPVMKRLATQNAETNASIAAIMTASLLKHGVAESMRYE